MFMAGVRKLGVHGADGVSISPASAPASVSTADGLQDQPSPGPSAAMAPAVLFMTVVLAVVLLVSAMLHVLRRLFLKSHRASARAAAVERQLQQLFHLHEDGAGPGLDQEAIDALPAFDYGELSGTGDQKKRQFDCAVCLCEFAIDDRLRLLPLCGHAFHVACIDTWLRSSSTCPLCRTAIATAGQPPPPPPPDIPVRLGRFKSSTGDKGEGSADRRIDARRCYSMGSSYQYVLADDDLVVSLHRRPGEQQGNKLCTASRRDSFSVSKIWQWRLPAGGGASSPADDRLPWAPTRTRTTTQETDT